MCDNRILCGIVGDIIGSTREWKNVKTEDFELIPYGSHFTDDTVMTLAVAQWLMIDPEHSETKLIESMQSLGRRHPNAGYGGMFRKWLKSDNPQPYGSFGNGSAMRVSPVGLYANSMEEALELARITASVTHNHPEGIKGAQAIAASVFLKRTERLDVKGKIKRYVEEHFGYNLDINLRDIRDEYSFDVTCQGSVPISIMAFLQEPYDAEKAIRLAISMGGDSDTIGCMTSSIAATNGPFTISSGSLASDIEEKCRKLLTPDLLEINDKFLAFIDLRLKQSNEEDNKVATHFAVEFTPDRSIDCTDKIRDSIRGSLMCGAAGDALGYPVEFMSRSSILSEYGPEGINTFGLDNTGKALVSDDTQMTLFTANGLLMGITRIEMRGIGNNPENYVDGAYIDWYYTQTGEKREEQISDFHYTWLRDLPELAHRRAPGNTCLSACFNLLHKRDVNNDSKGCGGIMRVAPLGLLLAGYVAREGRSPYSIPRMFEAGAYIAKVTHRHPLGFLPAGMLTELLFKLAPLSPNEAKSRIWEIAESTVSTLDKVFSGKYEQEKLYLAELTRKAIRLAQSDVEDFKAINELGEGWTGEEAWAVSLYCAIKHIDNIHDAIVASVNHDGDSDSTGSITGNIMGAIYGYEEIKRQRLFCPQGKEFEETLELSNIILALSDDLTSSCIINEFSKIDTPAKKQWFERYCKMMPVGLR